MKKTLRFSFITILILLLVPIYGCSIGPDAGAKDAVNKFFTSVQSVDYKAYNSVTSKFAQTPFSQFLIDHNVEDHYSDVKSDVRQKYISAVKNIGKELVQSYKITQTEKVSEVKYKVTAHIVYLTTSDYTNACAKAGWNSFFYKALSETESMNYADQQDYFAKSEAEVLESEVLPVMKNMKPSEDAPVFTVEKKDGSWIIQEMEF